MNMPATTARSVIARHLVWDNHGCMPLRPFDMSFMPQLARYRAAGVDVAVLNIGFGEQSVEEHVRVLAAFRAWLKDRPDAYLLMDTVDDIARARRQGKLAVAFNMGVPTASPISPACSACTTTWACAGC
jgi:membrane dipeptidase